MRDSGSFWIRWLGLRHMVPDSLLMVRASCVFLMRKVRPTGGQMGHQVPQSQFGIKILVYPNKI